MNGEEKLLEWSFSMGFVYENIWFLGSKLLSGVEGKEKEETRL